MKIQIKPVMAVTLLGMTAGLGSPAVVHGQETQLQQAVQAEARKPVTLAVLPFATPKGEEKMGQDISEMMTMVLSVDPGFRLVERAALMQVVSEQELSLTGLVDSDTAVKVGRLAGAQIIVTGRVFEMGQSRFVTAKMIGTETSLLDGAIERGGLDQPMDALVMALCEKVALTLSKSSDRLLAGEARRDPLDELVEKLKGRKLPVVAVAVREADVTRAAQPVLDPAVETEIKLQLLRAGVEIRDVAANELTAWFEASNRTGAPSWPRSLQSVDLMIVGEGFHESAGAMGKLQIASGRAEINMIDRVTGRILLAERVTTRGIDLSTTAAGKQALEHAGRALSVKILEHLVKEVDRQEQEKKQP